MAWSRCAGTWDLGEFQCLGVHPAVTGPHCDPGGRDFPNAGAAAETGPESAARCGDDRPPTCPPSLHHCQLGGGCRGLRPPAACLKPNMGIDLPLSNVMYYLGGFSRVIFVLGCFSVYFSVACRWMCSHQVYTGLWGRLDAGSNGDTHQIWYECFRLLYDSASPVPTQSHSQSKTNVK